jgi:hypothetical protein
MPDPKSGVLPITLQGNNLAIAKNLKLEYSGKIVILESRERIELSMEVLQTSALPLGNLDTYKL